MSARLAVTETRPVRRLSRQWFYDGLRTALWVTVITVLIWVYADLQYTDERNIRATLRIHADSAANLVLLEPTGELNVNFRVRGYRYSIDSLEVRLASLNWKLHYDVARYFEPGNHPVERIAELLAYVSEIRDAPLTVLSATPRNVNIHLDELQRVEHVRVEFDSTGGEVINLKLQPDHVDMLVPASKLGKIDSKLVLRTRPLDLSRLADREISRTVEVLGPPGIRGVRVLPASVLASFKVGGLSVKEFTVRVKVTTPKLWLEDGTWDKYQLKVKQPETWTRQVKVLGNRIDLERLAQQDIKAHIELVEAAKDLKTWEFAEVKVILPSGLKLRLAPEPIPQVGYRLEKRSPAPSGP